VEARWPGRLAALCALLGLFVALLRRDSPAGAVRTSAPAEDKADGIAARNPGDAGIGKDPAVIFADDFESWKADGAKPPPGVWGIRSNKTSLTRTVPGRITTGGATDPGKRVLEIACWREGRGSSSGGLSKKLGNYNHAKEGLGQGHDELHVRYYLKFDDGYEAVRNHGANFGGRDVKPRGSAWVGMAGIRDVASRGYFYSGLQPRGKLGSREMEMGFYSYHLDKRGPWGENYPVRRRIPIRVGTWHCVERRMKLNTVDPGKPDPAAADGVEELWVDGQLSIRKPDVRFRRVRRLRITYFSFGTYYHGLPAKYTRAKPIKVYFDNLVIARKYIGPVK